MEYVNAELSQFHFTAPKVIAWKFSMNADFSPEQYLTTEIKYKSSVLKFREQNKATVILELKIGEESERSPFYISAKISSNFTWNDELSSLIERLLNENAVTLLISYLRPMVSQFTSYAGFVPFNLPYLDVRQRKPQEK